MFNYEIQVVKLKERKSKLVGFASVIVDKTMLVSGFKIFDGDKGLIVAPPSHPTGQKDDNGKEKYWEDVRFIDEKESADDRYTPFQKELYAAILEEYKTSSRGSTASSQSSSKGEAPASTKVQGPKNPWY